MKKLYTFIALLLLSGVIFAQSQRVNGSLTAVKPIKGINSILVHQSKAIVDSLHYDGDTNTAIGTGGATSYGFYAFFPSATLATHAALGHYILSEKLFLANAGLITSAELRFYTDTLASALVYTQAFTPVDGWNNILLSSPFLIPSSGNLYIGYYLTVTGGYPAGCDDGPVNTNGNWTDFNNKWQHLTDLNPALTYNWNIRAMCGTLPTTPTPLCSPLAWAAGNVPVPTSVTSGNFTLSNIGSDTLICTGITGLSAPFTTTLVPYGDSLLTGETATFTFTYNPTVVGTNNQTVVIATNGGNITIDLSGTGTACGTAINTFPWVESFEGTFPPTCWTKANPDGGTGWDQIANGTTPLPGWNGGTMSVPTGGGTNAAFVTYNTGGATANDQWLITPKIAVQPNQDLTFQMLFIYPYADFVDVKVSTTTNAVASFTTTLLSIDTTQLIQNGWKQFTVHLSAYANQDIYIAFNEHVTDNFAEGAFIGLDLVKVDSASANPMAQCTPLAYAAGNVPIATTVTSGNFTLKNDGQGTLTCSGITGLSAPFTTTLVPASVSLAAGATTTFTFSFNPTVIGTVNQTVVIATNGGDITIALSGTGTNCGTAVSTYPWTEGFEGATFPPDCWTTIDADGDGNNWVAYTAAPHSGTKSASSASWATVPLTPNNYLITPKLNINAANLALKYWVATQDIDYPSEHYSVMVSTTGTAPANFTEVFNETLTDTAYHQITVPLSTYNGQNIYIAFRHFNTTDMYKFKIDDVIVEDITSINEVKGDFISVYPNPANDKLYIAANSVTSVDIYNVTGAKVASYGNINIINVADLAVGSYIVKVITDKKVLTQKINITR